MQIRIMFRMHLDFINFLWILWSEIIQLHVRVYVRACARLCEIYFQE